MMQRGDMVVGVNDQSALGRGEPLAALGREMHSQQTLQLQIRRPANQVVEECLAKADVNDDQKSSHDGRKGWNSFMKRTKSATSAAPSPALPVTLEVALLRDAHGSTGLELVELPPTSQREAEAAAAAAAAGAVADDNEAALEADGNPTDVRTSFSKGAAAAAAAAISSALATARCVAVAGVVKGSPAARCNTLLVGHVLLEVNGGSVVGCGVGEVVSRFKELHCGSVDEDVSPLTLRLRKPTVAELGVFKLQQRRQQAAAQKEADKHEADESNVISNGAPVEGAVDVTKQRGRQITRRLSSRRRSNSWDLNNLEVTNERKKDLQLSSDDEDIRVVSPHSNSRRLELKALAEAKMQIACMTFEHEEANRQLKRELKTEKKQCADLRTSAAALQREMAEQSVSET
jgi:hypothetical protein